MNTDCQVFLDLRCLQERGIYIYISSGTDYIIVKLPTACCLKHIYIILTTSEDDMLLFLHI